MTVYTIDHIQLPFGLMALEKPDRSTPLPLFVDSVNDK